MSCTADTATANTTENVVSHILTPALKHQSITFSNIMGQGRVNQLGGVFINGRPLPQHIRLKIVEMASNGVKPCHISRQLRVSHGCVSKILYRYAETGSILPGQVGGSPRSRKRVFALEECITQIYHEQPNISAQEIRSQLINKGLCSRSNAPAISTIHAYISNNSILNSSMNQYVDESPKLKYSIESILGISAAVYRNDISDRARRIRTIFTQDQLKVLEAAFRMNTYPDQELRELIAAATKLDEGKIQVWFSNRRARCRKSLALPTHNPFVLSPNSLTALFQETSRGVGTAAAYLLFNPAAIMHSADLPNLPALFLSSSLPVQ